MTRIHGRRGLATSQAGLVSITGTTRFHRRHDSHAPQTQTGCLPAPSPARPAPAHPHARVDRRHRLGAQPARPGPLGERLDVVAQQQVGHDELHGLGDEEAALHIIVSCMASVHDADESATTVDEEL